MTLPAASPAPPQPAPAAGRQRTGFTITEVIVVIGIIVLLIGLAVPAFSIISGGQSREGAQNVVAAALGRARAEAINKGEYTGVYFFRDTSRDRYALMLVSRERSPKDDPDPNDRYKSFLGNFYGNDPTFDQALFFTEVTEAYYDDVADTYVPRMVLKRYRRTEEPGVGSNNSIAPPSEWEYSVDGPTPENAQWVAVGEADTDQLPEDATGLQYMPVGVGIYLLDASGTARYLERGAIFFGPQGRLDVVDYQVSPGAVLGETLAETGSPLTATQTGLSSLGLVIFDRGEYNAAAENAGETGNTWLANDAAAAELWLGEFTTPLLVGRAGGQLIEAGGQ